MRRKGDSDRKMRCDSAVLFTLAVCCILFQCKTVLAEPWPYPMEKTIIGDLIFLGFPEKEKEREFGELAFEVKGWQSDVLEQAFQRYRAILTNPANHMEYEMEVQAPEKLMDVSNRIEKMIKAGAVQEVKRFNKLKVKKANSSFKIIGIREINELKPDKTNLSLIKEKITIKTRQYAKRQMTWARGHMKDWYRIAPNNLNSYLNKIS